MWGATERVDLVSSFVSSLLIGDAAPLDAADASGMNLLDLRSGAARRWEPRCLAALEVDGGSPWGGWWGSSGGKKERKALALSMGGRASRVLLMGCSACAE